MNENGFHMMNAVFRMWFSTNSYSYENTEINNIYPEIYPEILDGVNFFYISILFAPIALGKNVILFNKENYEIYENIDTL